MTGSDSTRGLLLGILGVVIFAMTTPMTRLAVGDVSAPQLPPAFVTAGRAAVAGVLSALYLLALRVAWPARRHWRGLAISALGTVVGFPLFLALAWGLNWPAVKISLSALAPFTLRAVGLGSGALLLLLLLLWQRKPLLPPRSAWPGVAAVFAGLIGALPKELA